MTTWRTISKSAKATLTLGFLVTAVLGVTKSTSFGQSNPYVVGIMVGLTGVAPEYGDVMSKSYIMALDEINEKGGVNGRQFKYILEDDNCTAKGAITAYNKLVHVDNVKLIFGPICSGSSLGIAPMLQEDHVIAFSTGGSDDITGASPLMFRNIPSARVGVEALAPFVYKDYKTVNMMTLKFDWSESLRQGFTKNYTALGGKIGEDELYGPDVTDFRSEITKAMRGDPPAIVLNSGGEPYLGTIIKQMKELGYKGQIISDDAAVTAGALKIAGDAAQGLIASVSPYVRPENQKGVDALAKFKKKYGYTSYEFYMVAGYDMPYIVAGCLSDIGDIDAENPQVLTRHQGVQGRGGNLPLRRKGGCRRNRNFIVRVEGKNLHILAD